MTLKKNNKLHFTDEVEVFFDNNLSPMTLESSPETTIIMSWCIF